MPSRSPDNTLQYSLSCSLPVCTCVCSPSPLAPSAALHLPPKCSLSRHSLTSGPSSSRTSPCSLTDACFVLSEGERACFNRKQREAGAECGVMSSKCCECSLAVVQRCICMSELLMCCLSPGLSKDTSCTLQSNTDASSLTAVGGKEQ